MGHRAVNYSMDLSKNFTKNFGAQTKNPSDGQKLHCDATNELDKKKKEKKKRKKCTSQLYCIVQVKHGHSNAWTWHVRMRQRAR